MVKHSSESLDAVFSALADPTRRAILERLSHGEFSVSELAEPFDMSLPAVSKHLRVLEKAGLLIREKEGRVHRFTTDLRRIQQAADWLDRYRNFWTAQFNALDKHLSKTRKD
jgi:DNA-binding transcriptional ArsR family regulator